MTHRTAEEVNADIIQSYKTYVGQLESVLARVVSDYAKLWNTVYGKKDAGISPDK